MFRMRSIAGSSVVQGALAALAVHSAGAATYRDAQARIDSDLAQGKPMVAHVTVVLCDNENQGIVPVPASLGDGRNPDTNLYWGALYGVEAFFERSPHWSTLTPGPPADSHILARAAFRATIGRSGSAQPVFLVADAWDGAHMEEAIRAFLDMAAGVGRQEIRVVSDADTLLLGGGGSSHLVAFVGHNGLMDFYLPIPDRDEESRIQAENPAMSAIVLACASKPFFESHLNAAGAHPLLLTTGLMAPEAYTLDAAVRSWAAHPDSSKVPDAAAQAYHQYQGCGLKAAQGLFWGAP